MMCSANQPTTSRRSHVRRIRPEDRCPTSSKQKNPLNELSESDTDRTVSLSASSRSSSPQSKQRPQHRASTPATSHFQRKLCPITGELRNISSDYHVFSTILGKGHYGCVRECEHRHTRKIYACKSVDKTKIRRIDHLRREVVLLSMMDHDNVMGMIDCYEDSRFVHIVTERYTGGELFDKISEKTTPDGCFDERRAANIIKSLLEAVAYLHENDIAHRDIKPENILFETSAEDSDVKLIDFGLSRTHHDGDALMTNPVGTAYYMSPEVLGNGNGYDKSCDVWSLGTIAYILLCGYPPFNGDTDPDIFEAIRRGKFSFHERAWAGKSDDAKDFISYLLDVNTNTRPKADEALDHVWIRNYSDVDEKEQDVKRHDDLVARIQSLRCSIKKFKKSAVLR
eukprot:CAMPEP_0181113082 /NCGR_PEP_ID=MMETSP1071-20121207/20155_1 /TAXON_ID=35127 /ORGANISM="Thalassiosira sp., Strain NH16" /LENGTH=396 /DNA_ID=CAMNT_0023197091 /DNA_START=240 /DNA_END=1430 /DNA_ORIENTATION=-